MHGQCGLALASLCCRPILSDRHGVHHGPPSREPARLLPVASTVRLPGAPLARLPPVLIHGYRALLQVSLDPRDVAITAAVSPSSSQHVPVFC